MNLYEYAKNELDLVTKNIKDKEGLEMQQIMNNDILEIIEKFSEQGHSGFSAGYLIKTIIRLLNYKPIRPLTGEDDEWMESGIPGRKQNKRCFSVFKHEDGDCYR